MRWASKYFLLRLFRQTYTFVETYNINLSEDDIIKIKEYINPSNNNTGYMYQIMDDFKDQKYDRKNANYILSLGKKRAIEKYNESKFRLKHLMDL